MSDDASNAPYPELPGSAYLGRGFDIFGQFALTLDGEQVVQRGNVGDDAFGYTGNGKTYSLRTNIDTPEALLEGGAANYSFDSRSEFRQHFSGSVGVDGSFGAFSGHIDAQFSGGQSNENEYSWGLVEQHYRGWRVALKDTGLLQESFRQAFNALRPFDSSVPAIVESYVAFFRRFGTHYVSEVTTGGHFRYYASISKDHDLSSHEIAVNVGAEYDGVMAKADVKSKAAWDRCTDTWMQNRQTHLEYVGYGDFPKVATPQRYTNEKEAVERAQETVQEAPVAVAFKVRPMWELVTNGNNLMTAFNYILNARVEIREDVITGPSEQMQGQFAFFVKGTEILVDTPLLYNMRGLKWAVLDRATLAVLSTGAIPQDRQFTDADWDAAYDAMGGDGLDDTRILLLGFQGSTERQPQLRISGRLMGLLVAMGADHGIHAWNKRADGDHRMVSYAIIGVPTEKAHGSEAVYLRRREPYARSTDPYTVSVHAFLELETEGGKFMFTPRSM